MSNIDNFAERFSMLTEEERKELLELVKLDKIKAEFENHKKSLSEKGYSMSSHSPSFEWAAFSKNVLEDEPTLHVVLERSALGEWKCVISHYIRTVTVSSGEFHYPHPRFEEVFESQVLAVAKSAAHLQPMAN